MHFSYEIPEISPEGVTQAVEDLESIDLSEEALLKLSPEEFTKLDIFLSKRRNLVNRDNYHKDPTPEDTRRAEVLKRIDEEVPWKNDELISYVQTLSEDQESALKAEIDNRRLFEQLGEKMRAYDETYWQDAFNEELEKTRAPYGAGEVVTRLWAERGVNLEKPTPDMIETFFSYRDYVPRGVMGEFYEMAERYKDENMIRAQIIVNRLVLPIPQDRNRARKTEELLKVLETAML